SEREWTGGLHADKERVERPAKKDGGSQALFWRRGSRCGSDRLLDSASHDRVCARRSAGGAGRAACWRYTNVGAGSLARLSGSSGPPTAAGAADTAQGCACLRSSRLALRTRTRAQGGG